ncbi:MAG: tRNA (N6-threonylcarbamoyladenosine(37)-N6)-methyltransferase TrmO, partial [Methanomicrobiales archaeon]|nr:tRNA (N6-threonylcarbamoyladenosine(37)-N6)-methyltransferase TrmO [Methanomicrobiales archaeon]
MAAMECIPIGFIQSPYRERGDAPRQGRLAADIFAEIHVHDAYIPGLEGVERSSHL